MLHDTLCVSGVGFLHFYCLQDNVKDQQAKQEETTWMAYRRIHGSCSPLVQDTLTIFISEHCNLEPNFLLVYFSYYFSCYFPWPPSSMAPFFPIVCHPACRHISGHTSSQSSRFARNLGMRSWWSYSRSGMEVGLGDVCWHVPGTFSGDFWLWNIMNRNMPWTHKNNSKEGTGTIERLRNFTWWWKRGMKSYLI